MPFVVLASLSSSNSAWMSSRSMTGTGGGVGSSTPRVARYSGLTVRRRWPLGSMFLDGTGDQLSGLKEKDYASEGDHAEGDPLDGVEEACFGVRLTQKGQQELSCAGGSEGDGEDISGVTA